MADSYLERVAGEIADLALADQEASGDITVVDMIAGVMGASSQTLEEAYLTAVRVRRAEARAREILAQRKANDYVTTERPPPAPMQYEDSEDDTEVAPAENAVAIDVETPDVQETATTVDDPDKPKVGMPRRVTR